MHKPIQFKNLSFSLTHKTCFSDFDGQILYGSRIAIIGSNGCGKSTLLKILLGRIQPTDGDIHLPKDLIVGYLPQVIESVDDLSGGQRLNSALTKSLALNPSILMLDEPTNHLDRHNRQSLIRMLQAFAGTLIMVTHDVELLQATVDRIWHIEDGQIHVFSGCYDDYTRELRNQRAAIETELTDLNQQKQQAHKNLMKEQVRAKSSRVRGEKNIQQRKWPTIVSASKARNAQETSGRKKSAINNKKQELTERLSSIHRPEIIQPKFSLQGVVSNQTLVTIHDGCVGYVSNPMILQDISLSIKACDRIAIQGNNGSGKSTLIKAILGDKLVITLGDWITPNAKDIGYLDQHYETLSPDKTVLETISCILPGQPYAEIRKHLNDFLFRKNEEIEARVSTLSGGEKARLSLAQIAAFTPKLLILDEMTNNLDLTTRDHVIQVLKGYPGAMMVISHDLDFVTAIGVNDSYNLSNGTLRFAQSE